MSNLTCPKCRQAMADDALDVGQCPACGFPIDGPMILAPAGAKGGSSRLLVASGFALALAGVGAAGYFLLDPSDSPAPRSEGEYAEAQQPPPVLPITHVAPFPHEPKPSTPEPNPTPVDPPGIVDVPRKGPRPVGVVMKVDPKIAAVRHFDQPDDIATLPDLNTNDRVVLTGRLRGLRIGSVHGKGSVDASGLVVEEVTVTGDLNNEASLALNAPNGKVTFGGFVYDSSRVTVTAPGGTVVIANSSRVSGGAILTITAKRFEANGPLSGAAKVHMMLSPGASLKFALMEDGANFAYQKTAHDDPPPKIEVVLRRGGARITEAK